MATHKARYADVNRWHTRAAVGFQRHLVEDTALEAARSAGDKDRLVRLPIGILIHNVRVAVETSIASKTFDVGHESDSDDHTDDTDYFIDGNAFAAGLIQSDGLTNLHKPFLVDRSDIYLVLVNNITLVTGTLGKARFEIDYTFVGEEG